MEQADPRGALDALVTESGVSYAALSRMLRRNDAYLQQYVRRGTPRILAERDRKLLAAYFRVEEVVLGGPADATAMAHVRRLDLVASAGPGAVAGDDPRGADFRFDPRLLDGLGVRPGSAALLSARGDSMAPTIADGDTMLVDERDRSIGATPAIFVVRLEGALIVKRAAREAGRLVLSSDNPAYPPITLSPPIEAEVIGRVVWLSRALR